LLLDTRAPRARRGSCLLWGTDIRAAFVRGKSPEDIVRRARIASFYREPFPAPGLRIPPIPGLANRLEVFDAGSVKISATEIRNRIARGESSADQVPEPVAEYITKQGLYSSRVAPA